MRRASRAVSLTLVALALAACGGEAEPPSIAVGATADPESQVLAHIYAGALRTTAPAHVEVVDDPLAGLDSGSVTVVPGFTGELLTTFEPAASAVSDEDVYEALLGALPEGITAGDYGPAEDKPALAVTEATADGWGDTDLTALARHCRGLTVGALGGDDPSEVGSCRIPGPREFADTAALFDAVRAGQVEAAWTSTADPALPDDVVVLSDETPLLRAENVVPLFRRNLLSEPQVLAINRIAGELDTDGLTELRRQVNDGVQPRQAAEAWLAEHPFGH